MYVPYFYVGEGGIGLKLRETQKSTMHTLPITNNVLSIKTGRQLYAGMSFPMDVTTYAPQVGSEKG
jgi:hypothetical protein